MGTIKDIVDLSTQLTNSVSDRKIADELNKIQRLTLQLQAEQAGLSDKNMELRESLLSEKELNHELTVMLKKLEDQAEEKENIRYEKPAYWKIDGDHKDGPFCQRCYDVDGKLVRLQDGENDVWRCQECDKVFFGPGYRF